MFDVDNAYVAAGLEGGLPGLILFLAIFVYGYRMVGEARSAAEESRGDARFIWAIGSALFANSIAFFGIVYFDQSVIVWYDLLVIISVVYTAALAEKCSRCDPETAVPIPVAWYD
jgi:O-antigen ligase